MRVHLQRILKGVACLQAGFPPGSSSGVWGRRGAGGWMLRECLGVFAKRKLSLLEPPRAPLNFHS